MPKETIIKSFQPARPTLGKQPVGWIKQPKLNGIRCIADARLKRPKLYTRNWHRIHTPEGLQLPYGIWDGELLSSGFYAIFDCIKWKRGRESQVLHPIEERLGACEKVHFGYNGVDCIWHLQSVILNGYHEGWVYKEPGSSYPQGKTHKWLKELI